MLELVTLVSVLQRQSRRLLLVLGGQNERAVLYGRQPDTNEAEAGRRPGHSWTCEAPPGQGLLPRRPACSPDHMPGTPRPPTLLQHNTALLLRLAPTAALTVMFTRIWYGPTPCSKVVTVIQPRPSGGFCSIPTVRTKGRGTYRLSCRKIVFMSA